MTQSLPRQIAQDARGVTAVEFGLIAPVLLLMIVGVFDLGHNMYSNTMLHGAVQKAARDATIEGASESVIDGKVADAVHIVAPDATLTFERTAYANFTDVQRPEDFDDLNGDGTCNNGEAFEDANGNGTWDTDRGTAGQGGARDAVLYEVTIDYPRLFPLANFMPISPNHSTNATTVLRNQPFAATDVIAQAGNCP